MPFILTIADILSEYFVFNMLPYKNQKSCFSGLLCSGFASEQIAQLHVIPYFLKKLLYYSSTLLMYLSSDKTSGPTCNGANVVLTLTNFMVAILIILIPEC